ncbi:MAG: GntR family transcriptional regulator, partial [Oscillospiraceae bacterium]|nr:GntR family transcriptional regulator [Oscillospiraceae bacterium]
MQEGKLEEHLKANMNSYLPLRDIVFFTLREAILMGDLEPGERLLEISLADKLGVSRTPVREAIRKLELEGLVLMLPRRGAEVASISGKNLRDVLEVRRGLEALTVELVVDHITAEQIAELDEANRHFESLLGGKNLTAIAEADEHFHELIY